MNVRMFTQTIIACGLAMLSLTNLAKGQLKSENPTPQLIKCSISVDSVKLERKKPAFVSIMVENISERDIDLKGVHSFQLLKNDREAIARNFSVRSDSYWSPLNISTGEPLKLIVEPEPLKKGIVVGHVPEVALHLMKGEVKTFRVELGKLLWNGSGLNDWPHDGLFDIVQRGPYWLVLNLIGNDKVQSNKVEVTVE